MDTHSTTLEHQKEPAALPAPGRFQILSLDGGGIKGILSAAILAKLEDDFGTRIVDHFDLIAGTSTGGIIALGLGLGLSGRDILQFYVEEGPRIFPSWFGLKKVWHWFAAKYSPAPIEAALHRCFGERKLGDSRKRLVIPAYDLSADDVYIFRTAHLERLRRDYKVSARQVARATSAAPTYFPSARGLDHLRLIDGGVWANNPSMVALVEAVSERNLNVALADAHLLSIGTSSAVEDRKSRLDNGGIIGWARGAAVGDVIMRGQSEAANNQAGLLLGERFTRLDPSVPPGKFLLDGVKSANELVARAAHDSRKFAPKFETRFFSHHAASFTPFHHLVPN